MRDRFTLVEDGFAAVDAETGVVTTVEEAAARLSWRWKQLAPSEPRMPRHCYVVLVNLSAVERHPADVLEYVIEEHPAGYDAFFRLYSWPSRYLEPGDGFRYWRSRIGAKWFVNRARPEDSEPQRRVDQGAKAIPRSEWGTHRAYHLQGAGFGEWQRVGGEWVWIEYGRDPEPQMRLDT